MEAAHEELYEVLTKNVAELKRLLSKYADTSSLFASSGRDRRTRKQGKDEEKVSSIILD